MVSPVWIVIEPGLNWKSTMVTPGSPAIRARGAWDTVRCFGRAGVVARGDRHRQRQRSGHREYNERKSDSQASSPRVAGDSRLTTSCRTLSSPTVLAPPSCGASTTVLDRHASTGKLNRFLPL